MGSNACVGPHAHIGLAQVAHRAWPKNPHACVECPCRPTHPTWPSLSGSHGHTPATTRPCLVHDHVFIDHTAMSTHTAIHMSDHMPVWRQ
ncbi:hypothetical protein J1N35_007974, partial [Gossypium stocksii]